MAQTAIYACDSDMLAVFGAVEKAIDLAYARAGDFAWPRVEIIQSGKDLPDLGQETSDSSVRSLSWLVTRRGLEITPRRIELKNGEVRHVVDQLNNEDTIEVTPGGRLGDNVVLSGRIATASDTPCANELMAAFRRALKKSFERIGAYWVGPAAAHVLDSGGRLTLATQSPPEFNLVRA